MKTMKTVFAVTILTLTPGLAIAQSCDWMKPETTAMSCAEGAVLDPATNTCVDQVVS